MNEKISNNDKENFGLIWRTFPSILRSLERSNRSCGNTRNIREICSTFSQTMDYITVLLKTSKAPFTKLDFYSIVPKKSNLKKTTLAILKILGDNSSDTHLYHSFSFILDAIDKKLYSSKSATVSKKPVPKYITPIIFDNKAV